MMRRYWLILLCMAAIVGKCFDASPLLQWVLADAGETAFSPDDISDLVVWLDASDSDTVLHTSNAVTNWQNKVDASCCFTAVGGASARPSTNTRTQNSRNVIDFDGTSDYLKNTTASSSLPLTVFMVCAVDNVIGVYSMFDSANTTYRLLIRPNAGVWQLFTSSLGTNNTGGNYTATGWNLLRYEVTSGGSQSLYSTNTLQVTHSGITQGYDGIMLGTDATPSPYFDGAFAEILMYNRALTTDQITQLETYLADKWGI